MSDSDGGVVVAEEATPESLVDQSNSHHSNNPNTSTTQSCQSIQENGALSVERTDNQGSSSAAADVTSISHSAEVNKQSTTHVSTGTVRNIHDSNGDGTLAQGAGSSPCQSSTISSTPCATICAENSTAPSAGLVASAAGRPYSTSTPLAAGGQRYPSQLTRNYNQDREHFEREEEEENWEEVAEGMGNVAGSILGYSPLVFENNEEGGDEQLDELYVPISGYEVMEQRAKFTVSIKFNLCRDIRRNSYFFPNNFGH
nr:uncharacterized protein LOC129269268 [Lytechinus pictus]